jgi:hypothetical protein
VYVCESAAGREVFEFLDCNVLAKLVLKVFRFVINDPVLVVVAGPKYVWFLWREKFDGTVVYVGFSTECLKCDFEGSLALCRKESSASLKVWIQKATTGCEGAEPSITTNGGPPAKACASTESWKVCPTLSSRQTCRTQVELFSSNSSQDLCPKFPDVIVEVCQRFLCDIRVTDLGDVARSGNHAVQEEFRGGLCV